MRMIRSWALLALPLLALCAWSQPSAAPAPLAADAGSSQPVSDQDFGVVPEAAEPLPNFHQVAEGIYRSAEPKAEGFKRLAQMGIKTILDLKLHVDDDDLESAAALGMKIESVPMNGLLSPSFAQLDRALAVLQDPAKKPVLIHCRYGRDRTGVTVAAYRVAVQGVAPAAAAQEAQSFGCCPPLFKNLPDYLSRYLQHRQAANLSLQP